MSQWVRKRWPFALQSGLLLGIIEQLAVEDDRDGAILVADGLPAVGQADDAQPAVGEADAGVLKVAVLIRAAVHDGIGHRDEGSPRKEPVPSQIDRAGDSAHVPFPLSKKALLQLFILPKPPKLA